MSAPYVICVGKEYKPGKNKFTEIGVGFSTKKGTGIKIQLDLKLILGPNDNIYVFPKSEKHDNDD
jgi:hypothetical protein